MPAILGIIIALIVIYAAIMIAAFVVLLSVVSAPGWGSAAITTALVLRFLRRRAAKRIAAQSGSLVPHIDGDVVKWTINEPQVSAVLGVTRSVATAVLAGSAVGIGMLVILETYGAFLQFRKFPDAGFALGCAVVLVFIAVTVIANAAKPTKAFKDAVGAELSSEAQELSERLEALAEITEHESAVQRMNAELRANIPAGYVDAARRILAQYLGQLRIKAVSVQGLLTTIAADARDDAAEVARVLKRFRDVERLFREAALEVNKRGSASLFTVLDEMEARISSANLRVPLDKKDWTAFHHAIDAIDDALRHLRDNASSWQEEGHGDHRRRGDDRERGRHGVDWAMTLLGLNADAGHVTLRKRIGRPCGNTTSISVRTSSHTCAIWSRRGTRK